MADSFGAAAFQYLYQISPIILTGGLASQFPGGAMSIASFAQAIDFGSIIDTAGGFSLDDFFAQFVPMAGSTLIDNDVATYPFANQTTAANAIITKPLAIAYRMICPARGPFGFAAKQAVMIALKQTLQQHNLLGGLYFCATPAFFWDSCVMRAMRDVTAEGETTQRQVIWQLEFEQPLVTQAQAQQQYNTLLAKINSGTQIQPDGAGAISGSSLAAGAGNPLSGQAPGVSPAAQSPGLGYEQAPNGSGFSSGLPVIGAGS